MKRLTAFVVALLCAAAHGTTLNPIQLLNPAGSSSGQAIVSTGASSAPAWGGVGVNGIAAIAANTVLANATGSSASPTAFAMPSCSATGNALNWTTSTGFTCQTGLAPLASPTFTGTPAAPTAAFGTNTTQIATTAFVQASGGGKLINVQTFTATGTYTPTAGTNAVVVEVVGGGGAGGGTPATSATQNSVGGSGGSGAWAIGRITSGFSGVAVTVGAAGAGAAGAAGGNGGQSSFGAAILAPGGLGGALGALVTAGVAQTIGGVTSSVATGGSILNTAGSAAIPVVWSFGNFLISAPGASCPYGSGAGPAGSSNSGNNATGHGAGGSGAAASISQAALAGGNGSSGMVIIYEYQ